MKKTLKRFAAFLLAVVILSAGFAAMAANPSVVYTGNSGNFIFSPGSKYSPTDLFEDFKGVMPGDSLLENIEIHNKANNRVVVKIYMRALGANEGSEELLSQMKLRVAQAGIADPRFEAPADETAQLTDWVLLGTFSPGAATMLDVTLEVPIEMGNDFQNAVGELVWQFRVDEYPSPFFAPGTGDDTTLALYAALLGGGTLLLLFLLFTRKCRKSED